MDAAADFFTTLLEISRKRGLPMKHGIKPSFPYDLNSNGKDQMGAAANFFTIFLGRSVGCFAGTGSIYFGLGHGSIPAARK
ncbi:hypothetical protein N0M98_18705 [Paenibacillus doosanensis]|uniref:hypothetical protein n=1 Tax=Paenibacillus doosanensis TaxID=1229154 RepID=UPI00217FFCC1|nr:hypothetical protein [Paenibacillus doosanensis]MCS7462173.1 hypothetical protein [Paenibacillus doosanensis]